jgi:hypothetical protein
MNLSTRYEQKQPKQQREEFLPFTQKERAARRRNEREKESEGKSKEKTSKREKERKWKSKEKSLRRKGNRRRKVVVAKLSKSKRQGRNFCVFFAFSLSSQSLRKIDTLGHLERRIAQKS